MSDIFGNNNFMIPCIKEVQTDLLARCVGYGFYEDRYLCSGMKGKSVDMRRKGVNQSCLFILTGLSGETQAECWQVAQFS
jgi:hypothetical protein